MSKSVLISIKPKYCKLIASGEKTIEVRKSRPKLKTPFKVYIYCSKDRGKLLEVIHDNDLYYNERYHGKPQFIKAPNGDYPFRKCGKVIGEFVCDRIDVYRYNKDGYGIENQNELLSLSCLSEKELYRYLQGKKPHAWHISDLIIYDTPKVLSDFTRCEPAVGSTFSLKRAPQSWCYVEEL